MFLTGKDKSAILKCHLLPAWPSASPIIPVHLLALSLSPHNALRPALPRGPSWSGALSSQGLPYATPGLMLPGMLAKALISSSPFLGHPQGSWRVSLGPVWYSFPSGTFLNKATRPDSCFRKMFHQEWTWNKRLTGDLETTSKGKAMGLDIVAHACDPSYSEGRGRRMDIPGWA
jgi:hypothetical protein